MLKLRHERRKLTHNDIAALIVEIEPTDLADLARVRRALNVIAESSPTSTQRLITEVVKKIDRMTGERPLTHLWFDIHKKFYRF
jgi:hypothetical protein